MDFMRAKLTANTKIKKRTVEALITACFDGLVPKAQQQRTIKKALHGYANNQRPGAPGQVEHPINKGLTSEPQQRQRRINVYLHHIIRVSHAPGSHQMTFQNVKLTARVASIILLILGLVGCDTQTSQTRPERPAVSVIVEPIALNTQRTVIQAVGTSRALQSVTLHPASSGEIVRINFTTGQHVDADDVLVELDQRKELLAVELAKFRLSEAERLFERYRRSAETGATLPTTLDTALTELEAAKIALGQAEIALQDRNIVAPFPGHVGITQFDPGDRVQLDTPITTLDNRDALLVTFELPELLMDYVVQGLTVDIRTWEQQAEPIAGEIIEIDSRIDPALRTFVARAVVSNEDDRLRPGMSFRVALEIPGDPYPVMPEIAVQWGAEGAYVWKVVDGHAERIRVKVVQRLGGMVMVDGAGALNEADVIVTEGIQRLRPGLPVTTRSSIAADADVQSAAEASRG